MKHIIILTFSILLFSCNVYTLDENVQPENSLNEIAFPISGDEKPNPIMVENAFATNNESDIRFKNKIEINWDLPSAGVKYTAIFNFVDKDLAVAEVEKFQTTFYYKENLNQEHISPKLSYITDEYILDSLDSDEQRFFVIKFFDEEDRLMGISNVVEGGTAIVPYGVDATRDRDDGIIRISWNWDYQFDEFNVFRSENSNSGFVEIDSSNYIQDGENTFYLDDDIQDNGKFYYYKISAIDNGKESSMSYYATGTTISTGTPSAPINFSVSDQLYGEKIVLNWEAVTSLPKVTSYIVYTKSNTTWDLGVDVGISTTYECLTTDDSDFEFYVVAVNILGQGSPSEIGVGSIITIPNDIEVSIFESSEYISLNWGIDKDLALDSSFSIFRSTVSSELGIEIESSVTELSYKDESCIEGQIYYYSIAVKNIRTDEIGLTIDNKNSYGVSGHLEEPLFTVSQGSSDKVILNFENKPSYLHATVKASRPVYMPIFILKEAYETHVIDSSSTKPVNYEDSLCYKMNPNRQYTAFDIIDANIIENSWSDTESTPGYNNYSVSYVYGDNLISTDYADVLSGYRTITDEEFCDEMLMTIEKSQFKLTYIHRDGMDPSKFDAVEDDTISDNGNQSGNNSDPSNGWLHYDPRLDGVGAIVPMYYNNYQDYDMIFNTDETDVYESVAGPTSIINITDTKQGYLGGKINITGIYSGYVIFDIAVGHSSEKPPYTIDDSELYDSSQNRKFHYSGKKSPGFTDHVNSHYVIKQTDSNPINIDWDYNRIEVDDMLKKPLFNQ